MSRVRRYSRSGPTAQPPRSPTGLSPPAVTRSSGLRLTRIVRARRLPPPPVCACYPETTSPAGCAARWVWAPPRSLAATEGILSSPRGTEMFQFPRLPLVASTTSARACPARVAPFGYPRIAGRQRLPGAFRRVTASFLGRHHLGIPRVPFLRSPTEFCLVPHQPNGVWTGARQPETSRLVPRQRPPEQIRSTACGTTVSARPSAPQDALARGGP